MESNKRWDAQWFMNWLRSINSLSFVSWIPDAWCNALILNELKYFLSLSQGNLILLKCISVLVSRCVLDYNWIWIGFINREIYMHFSIRAAFVRFDFSTSLDLI